MTRLSPASKPPKTFAAVLLAGLGLGAAAAQACEVNGIELKGKVEIVDSFPDLKVQVVDSFPDLKVQKVTSFADSCGQWEIVSSSGDFKVQIVDSFPDLKIQYVDSFPGMN